MPKNCEKRTIKSRACVPLKRGEHSKGGRRCCGRRRGGGGLQCQGAGRFLWRYGRGRYEWQTKRGEDSSGEEKEAECNNTCYFLKVENKPHLYCNNYAFILVLRMEANIYGSVMYLTLYVPIFPVLHTYIVWYLWLPRSPFLSVCISDPWLGVRLPLAWVFWPLLQAGYVSINCGLDKRRLTVLTFLQPQYVEVYM